jgi:hypothetical protein
MQKTEAWERVRGFPNYEVSDLGRVRSLVSGRLIALVEHKVRGSVHAICVRLWCDRKSKLLRVHRLVLTAFVREPNPGEEGCHGDNDPTRNHLENLRWGTAADNAADRVRHGTAVAPPITLGEAHGLAKLTTDEVRQIRSIGARRGEYSSLGRRFGISGQAVKNILDRKVWRHVD